MSDRVSDMESERMAPHFGRSMIRMLSYVGILFVIAILVFLNIKIAGDSSVMVEDDATDHCGIQLESTKSLIKVLKKSNDNSKDMLLAAQDYNKKHKDSFHDVFESYYTMTQESSDCQDRLDALQLKCKAN